MKQILTWSSLGLLLSGLAIAEDRAQGRTGRPPLQSVSVDRSEAETACSFFVAAAISKNEDLYPDEFKKWRFQCANHPDAYRCQDAYETVKKRPEFLAQTGFKCPNMIGSKGVSWMMIVRR
jgi:hypothetical protein